MELKRNQVWVANGHSTEWIIDEVFEDKSVMLTKNRANAGHSSDSKIVPKKHLERHYTKKQNKYDDLLNDREYEMIKMFGECLKIDSHREALKKAFEYGEKYANEQRENNTTETQFFKRGDIFNVNIKHEKIKVKLMIAQVSPHKCQLINIENGNRWGQSTEIKDVDSITESEIIAMLGCNYSVNDINKVSATKLIRG